MKRVSRLLIVVGVVGFFATHSFCGGEEKESQESALSQDSGGHDFLDTKEGKKSSYTIKNIIVEGTKYTKEALVLNSIPYKKGDIFDVLKSAEAIDNLYALGHYNQIRIEGEKLSSSDMNLYVVVEEKKLLADLKISGNRKISTKKIKEQLNLENLKAIDDEVLRQIALSIKKIYKEENRHFVGVNTKLIPDKENPDKVVAEVKVTEGASSSIARVHFVGNKHLPDRVLRNKIFTRENWLLSFTDGAGVYKDSELDLDKHRIIYQYKDLGYLMAKITKTDVKFSKDKKKVDITFHIQEGARYIINSVKAPGDEIFTEDEIKPLLGLEEGKPYSQGKIIATLSRLRDLWGIKGYIYADVYPEVKPDEKTKKVDITFNVDRGNKMYANRIIISGNTITRDKVIRRRIDIVEGDLITTPKMRNSQSSVEYLSFFKRDGVNWKMHRIDDTTADLEMNVQEDKTGSLNFQLSYGTDRYNPRRSIKGMISVEKRNLFGLGWDAGGLIEASRHRLKRIESHFFDPSILDSDVSGAFSFYKRWDEYDQWRNVSPAPLQKVLGVSTKFGFQLPQIDPRLQLILGVGIEDIRNNHPHAIGDLRNIFEPIVRRTFQTGFYDWVSAELIKDTRNHQVYPNQGYKVELITRAALPVINREFGFFNIEAALSTYMALIGSDSLVLANRVKIGRIDSFGGKNKHNQNFAVPYKELYHMGGQGTIRGHTWGGVGPAWVTGEPLGAKNMIQWNTELIFPLIPDYSMKAHLFYDAGAGWSTPLYSQDENKYVKRNNFDLRHSVGFGINLMKPIPAKIDWGFKLDRKRGESPHEFHLDMNYAW
ncbi:MAG: outer membrane protein assembly factor BamA [bacterium]